MQKVDVLEKSLNKIDETKLKIEEENEESRILDAYIELFSLYDDIIKHVNKDKEEFKAIEATKQIYIKMGNYFTSRKLSRVIEKNIFQVQSAHSRFNQEGGLENIWSIKKNLKYKGIAPQDMVKLYDNLLQIFKQLIDIEASNPNFKEIKSLECKELAYKFLRQNFVSFHDFNNYRIFYIACTHISYGRILEGYSFLVHLENEYAKLRDYCQNYNLTLEQVIN